MCVGVLEFLSFSNERKSLRRYLDGVSNRIYIPSGLPFGLQRHTVAYVSSEVYYRSNSVEK